MIVTNSLHLTALCALMEKLMYVVKLMLISQTRTMIQYIFMYILVQWIDLPVPHNFKLQNEASNDHYLYQRSLIRSLIYINLISMKTRRQRGSHILRESLTEFSISRPTLKDI